MLTAAPTVLPRTAHKTGRPSRPRRPPRRRTAAPDTRPQPWSPRQRPPILPGSFQIPLMRNGTRSHHPRQILPVGRSAGPPRLFSRTQCVFGFAHLPVNASRSELRRAPSEGVMLDIPLVHPVTNTSKCSNVWRDSRRLADEDDGARRILDLHGFEASEPCALAISRSGPTEIGCFDALPVRQASLGSDASCPPRQLRRRRAKQRATAQIGLRLGRDSVGRGVARRWSEKRGSA
jgi:hypothetical protein